MNIFHSDDQVTFHGRNNKFLSIERIVKSEGFPIQALQTAATAEVNQNKSSGGIVPPLSSLTRGEIGRDEYQKIKQDLESK